MLVALARSYVALGARAPDAPKIVSELADGVDDPLKTQLVGMIGRR